MGCRVVTSEAAVIKLICSRLMLLSSPRKRGPSISEADGSCDAGKDTCLGGAYGGPRDAHKRQNRPVCPGRSAARSKPQRSSRELKPRCDADPGPSQSVAVPDQRCTTSALSI